MYFYAIKLPIFNNLLKLVLQVFLVISFISFENYLKSKVLRLSKISSDGICIGTYIVPFSTQISSIYVNVQYTVRAPLKTADTLKPLSFYIRRKYHLKKEYCNISLSRTTSRSDAILDSTSKEKQLEKIEIYFMGRSSKVKRLGIMIYLFFGQNLLLST